ncbi:hypothetical protein GIB67_015116 [Kingdonia uniflora]|uniref:Stress-related protein n=1 Tax=Kingdonia uniflora TaxID=39325 RepID=A0A7J7LJD2_9MAGN|nr:hypothetical protein GIB67_015116 [Kingdonia uniflora]
MAETEAKQQPEMNEENEQTLKYLDFVQIATLQFLACFSGIYNYAKDNSGPLKPGVQTVEDTVKTVIGPVYEKFHDVPFELLKFVDRKVDSSVSEVERHVPSLLMQASCQAYSAAQNAPEMARSVALEVKRVGVVDTVTEIARTVYTKCEPTAKDLYAKYEPVAEQQAVWAWQKLNQLPVFPQVAQIVVPTAAYWSEKYNRAVVYTTKKGYRMSSYLPLVPIEKIAKTFGGEESDEATSDTSDTTGAEADDDDVDVAQ